MGIKDEVILGSSMMPADEGLIVQWCQHMQKLYKSPRKLRLIKKPMRLLDTKEKIILDSKTFVGYGAELLAKLISQTADMTMQSRMWIKNERILGIPVMPTAWTLDFDIERWNTFPDELAWTLDFDILRDETPSSTSLGRKMAHY